MSRKPTADGYIRVSRRGGRAGDSFISPEVQRKKIADWAKLHEVEILRWWEEIDQSGAKLERPMFQEALARCEAGETGGVVVARLDRFARSAVDALSSIRRLNDAGARLVSVEDNFDGSTAMGRFAIGILTLIAELELERIKSGWESAVECVSRQQKYCHNGGHARPNTPGDVIGRVHEQHRGCWVQMTDPIPLVKDDGTPFSGEEVTEASAALDALDAERRVDARNRNAGAIAEHDAPRMLIVSGPGTGKSTLFKSRLQHLLPRYPEHRVAVATFVRKLVQDLKDDISNDETISAEDKGRIEISTLHRLARSIVERSHGTRDLPFREHCLVITPFWEEIVWEDAVSLEGETVEKFPWAELLPHLLDAEEPGHTSWTRLRASHLRVSQFYNALTFADLILAATRSASEDPELVESTLFIIDEFQDFNLAEEGLIRVIAADSESLLLVGDDDQVLYEQLRRGHASIIRSYYRDTSFVNGMLPFCSRCSFHITKNADAFLASNRPAESIQKIFLPLDTDQEAQKVKSSRAPIRRPGSTSSPASSRGTPRPSSSARTISRRGGRRTRFF